MNLQKTKAFTLVELIVTITILAILWTIAFISLQWYSKTARDSVRVSDIRSMEISLELFQIDSWIYPEPTKWVAITYLWAEVWTQGTLWNSVIKNLQKLNKIPLDPLTNNEYTYSRLNTKKEYEIWAILEWDLVSSNAVNLINQTQATEKIASTYIKWTYNGIVSKLSTWSIVYILAVPSIITTDINEVTLEWIIVNQKLSYNNTKNIPSSYIWYNQTWWLDYNSTTPNNIIVFQWDIKDLTSSWTLQINFIENLQAAYTWSSVLINNSDIKNILSADIVNDPNWTTFLSQVLIQQTIDKNIEISAILNSLTEQQSWSWTSSSSSLTKLSLWTSHSCFVLDTWWVKCWWFNTYWQLWDWTTTDRYTPIDVVWLTWVVSVSLWTNFSCALLDTWWVKCWWRNNYGQLWDWTTTTQKNTPVDVIWLTTWVSNIWLWDYHTCALLDTWWIKCWGYNNNWQLWDNTTTQRNTPVDVIWLTAWVSNISLWDYHTCVLLDTWWVKCWWKNNQWQLWDGTTTTPRMSPVDVIWLTSWVSSISLWDYYTCALLDTWWVKCWGYNNNWQLWDNTTTRRTSPVDVIWLTSWVSSISLWYYYTCALLDTWWIKCWWNNYYGQLWDWTILNRNTPVDVVWLTSWVSNISLWFNHACALLNIWWLKCWWYNTYWQLWDWSNFNTFYPTPIDSWYTNLSPSSYAFNMWNSVTHLCIVVNWWVKCLWNNTNWQLWNGTTENSNVLVDVTWLTSGVSKVYVWNSHSCALLNTWWVKCWGYNASWQLWDNTTTQRTTPVDVIWLTSWVSSISLWTDFSCALLDTWWIKCWWVDNLWQLWNWSALATKIPWDVSWLTSWVSSIWASIAHACALLNTWWVKCWWRNLFWEIWDNTTTTRTSPVDVNWLISWVSSLSIWNYHTCVSLTAWWVKCWWQNQYWKLWDNTTINKYTPVSVIWITWVVSSISLWTDFSCALLDTWLVKCWWNNTYGQLWDWTTTQINTPVDVSWLTSWVSNIYSWDYYNCASLTSWWVKCWWKNDYLQLLDWYDYYLKRDVLLQ
jgi:prepilin-type N-terminal cleavage/methylation domain-containing protein